MIVIFDTIDMFVNADNTVSFDGRYWTKTQSGPFRTTISPAGTVAMKAAFEAALVAVLAEEGITTSAAELRRLSAL